VRKVYELDDTFATGEATVQPVLLWGANGKPLRERFTKTASEASDYIQSVQPQPGKSIVLVLALGAYETYDLNRNGDGFNEFPYRTGFQPSCGCCKTTDGWVSQPEVLPNHYKTFEQYGKVYKHHVNKDPAKSFGDVLKAFWNPTMHRVELLVGVDNKLAPDLAQRIADGEYPAVSMGCRIKYDVCTICGHRAPTRKEYCDHLKFGLRQVHKSGLRAGALNPSPKFFDISFVVKPADQTGYMLKKVAFEGSTYEVRTASELGSYMDAVDEKRAAIQKVSDIDKTLRGIPVDHKTSPLTEAEALNIQRYRDHVMPHVVGAMPELDNTTIKSLSQHPIKDVLSTLTAAGVILTTPEFVKLMVEKLAPGTQVPEQALDAIVAMQGQIFDLYAKHPQMLDQVMHTGVFEINGKNVKPEIGGIAEQYLEKRSTISDYLARAIVPAAIRTEEPHWTDTLHVRDSGTGDLYTTTRGAAVKAHDAIAKKQLMKTLGGAALLAGAYKLLAPGLPGILRPVAAGTAALIGAKHLKPDYGPHYMSEEGVPVSTLTEMVPEKNSSELSAVALPVLGSAALVTALGHDYDSRLRKGQAHDPSAPIHKKLMDRLGSYASDHPALSILGALGSYGLGKNFFNKLSEYIGDLTLENHDGVYLPEVDIDKVAEKLGSAVVPQ
jgi:hypothetical protein